MKRARTQQDELPSFPKTHGGKRTGAGRKRKAKSGVPHRERTEVNRRHPLLVTIKLLHVVRSLRTRDAFRVIEKALLARACFAGVAIVEFSVQRDHLHLIVEAEDTVSLSRAMQGLNIRIARGLNALLGRRGKVLADRFHSRSLKTPREVKNALAYVLGNARKHAAKVGLHLARAWLDPFSSALAFAGWLKGEPQKPRVLPSARTWLLGIGWTRHGLLDPAAVPG